MATLKQLVTKQQSIKKLDKKLYIFTGIASSLFLLSIIVTAFIGAVVYALIVLAFVVIILFTLLFINSARYTNTTNLITKNIQLILYEAINNSIECVDAEIVFENNENQEECLCYLVEAYGKNVTYNDLSILASVIDSVAEDVNKVIQPNMIVYYRIDNDY